MVLSAPSMPQLQVPLTDPATAAAAAKTRCVHVWHASGCFWGEGGISIAHHRPCHCSSSSSSKHKVRVAPQTCVLSCLSTLAKASHWGDQTACWQPACTPKPCTCMACVNTQFLNHFFDQPPLCCLHRVTHDCLRSTVTVWEWTGAAADEGDEAAAWFSKYLDTPVRLVR